MNSVTRRRKTRSTSAIAVIAQVRRTKVGRAHSPPIDKVNRTYQVQGGLTTRLHQAVHYIPPFQKIFHSDTYSMSRCNGGSPTSSSSQKRTFVRRLSGGLSGRAPAGCRRLGTPLDCVPTARSASWATRRKVAANPPPVALCSWGTASPGRGGRTCMSPT